MQQLKWVALGYNVPVNPSKNRVYVWRKLKEMGVAYFKQGVAVLPKNQKSIAAFRALAAKIRSMKGEASLIEITFLDPEDEQEFVSRFRLQSEGEYGELMRDCANLMESIRHNLLTDPALPDHIGRMIKRYTKVKQRDYFKSEATALEEMVADILDTAKRLGL
ncbi:Chromate resistance protein ChrB [Oscillospiraceae bacterium MB08-C2-2]|nr:Chromate resistance protein ChrB [Oscillospiraceae bacterium MB08-C2-2]